MSSFILEPGEGRALPIGSTVKFEDPAGAFAVLEEAPPPGAPAPYDHIHNRYDEAWLVLGGEFEFRVGDQRLRAGPSTLVFCERGTPHTFKNVSDAPAPVLLILSPIDCLRMLEEIGEIVVPGEDLDREKMAEIYRRHDTVWVPPLD